MVFVGTGNDTWIQFADVNGQTCGGLALDNVRLDVQVNDPVVPEASMVALLPLSALALAGAGFLILRRRPAT